MDVESKLDLLNRAPTEEVLTQADARNVFETNSKPNHYIGYEISGRLHVGSLIAAGFKVNDLTKAGCKTRVFLADWHAWINDKFENDLEKMALAGKYYKEAFEFFCPGVQVSTGTDLYHNNDDYWRNIIQFSKRVTLARDTRCLTIMGRSEKDAQDVAKFIYPPMQACDIRAMDIDFAHAGLDQRKVHVLAREVFPKLKWKVPVCLHHHLLAGLLEPAKDETGRMESGEASKMSKSKPDTAIFIQDSRAEIERKLKGAWCPEKTIEGNPVLDIVKNIVFHQVKELHVERPAKFGGKVTFGSYSELETAFKAGALHPADLKTGVANALDAIIKPVREHFEKPAKAKLLDVYKTTKITR